MNCSPFEPWLIDLARGVALDADRMEQVRCHLRDCARCEARLERERAVSAALRRLAADSAAPAWDPASERVLLDAFDAVRMRRKHAHAWFVYPAAAAALVAVALTVGWTHEPNGVPAAPTSPPPLRVAAVEPPVSAAAIDPAKATPVRRVARPTTRPARRAGAAFISWPGAGDLPAFESGELMRVDLPASVALSLGLVRAARTTVVQADVLIGQDGFARAVRLAP